MSHLLQPTIVLLKDGSDQAQGKDHVIHNINACQSISEIIKTTLGPRGMDKLIYTQNGQVTISNDGRTIIDLLDIVHPAAKTLVDIAVAQDNEVGDGTTSVVILASEFLKQAKQFIEDGVHPRIIIEAYRKSCEAVLGKLEDLSQDKTKIGQQLLKITDSKKETNDDKEETNDTNTNDKKNTEETNKNDEETESKDDKDDKEDPMSLKEILMKCAKTALQSKLISSHRDFFANIAVQAVQCLDSDLNLEMIGIAKVPGGSVTSCELVHGVAFKKTFSYAGFEQQPKKFKEPLIAVINVELELKAEKENAEIRLKDPKQYQSIVDAEWKIIYDKLDSLVKSGAKVILSKLAIGDVATQYFADRDVFCAGRVPEADLKRVCLATGATMQTSLGDLNEEILGKCGNFVEKQVGSQRYNFFLNCEHAKTATIILRGGAEQFIEETHRSLWDALMVVKRCIQHHKVVGGAGAIEMELSRYLRQLAKSVKDKSQIIMSAYARALEIIPKQLCYNAGIDAVEIVSKLRFLHQKGEKWMGVDIENGDVIDSMKTFIWEPSLNKKSAIAAATEAACLILSIDETIKNAKASENNPQANQLVPKPGRQGTGRPSIM